MPRVHSTLLDPAGNPLIPAGGSGGGASGPDILATSHGAVADNGTTDNTTALNNAITAASNMGGGKVVVQAPGGGAFGISGIVNLKSNVEIEFRSPLIFAANAMIRANGTLSSTTSALTVAPTPGATTITVANGGLFAVGNYILIDDDSTGANVSGSSSNKTNVEVNEIMAISGNVLTVAHPVNLAYVLARNAKVTRIDPLRNIKIKGARASYTATPTDKNAYSFSFKYCVDCVMQDCQMLGDPATGIGSSAQAFRMEGCYRCLFDNLTVYRPSDALSGEGYGIAVYFGTRQSVVRSCFMSGCRHSLILFQGVSDNLFEGNISIDCRGTDFDLHGANEIRNSFIANVSIGGPSETDINDRAAFKIGNTTHRVGSHRNTFIANEVHNHECAFHIVPSSNDNIIQANTIQNCDRGVFLQRLSADLALKIQRNIVTNNTFRRTGEILYIDGNGTGNRSVVETTFSNNTAYECPLTSGAAVKINYADGLIAAKNDIHALNDNSAVVAVIGSINVRAAIWQVEGGAGYAIDVDNSPDTKMANFIFAPRSSNQLLNLGTTNPGIEFVNYVALGFTPTFGGGAASPNGTTIKVTAAGSGGGTPAPAFDPYWPTFYGSVKIEHQNGLSDSSLFTRGAAAADQVAFNFITLSDQFADRWLGLPQTKGWTMVGRANAHATMPNWLTFTYWDGSSWYDAFRLRADQVMETTKRPIFAGNVAWDAGNFTPRYDIAPYIAGKPLTNENVYEFVTPIAISFKVAMAGSVAKSRTAATASTTFTLLKNDVSFGTIVFAAGATTATFTAAAATSFAVGDKLTIRAPATVDATLADIAITLAGSR